ncbi:MAG: tetratricopeptide repeat protein, partial [Candidatus Krumholzibacteria bacterium]|nr:tetratricopeptide repeat protein [Candidatus Krumholzibacteria bacterium]
MPNKLKILIYILIPLLILDARVNSRASADPVTTFIIRADSLAQAGGDKLLVPYIEEKSVLVGAAIGQLLDVAIEVGDSGDEEAERENVAFAEHLGALYRESTGSAAPLELVETCKNWTPEQRAARSRAKKLEGEAANARNTGKLDRAVELFKQAKSLYRGIGDLRSQAVTWGSLGVVHWYRGDMENVIESYKEALAARRVIEDRILEGKTLNGLGSANLVTGNYEVAVEFYKKAVELRRKTGDLAGLGTSLTYMGNTFVRMGRLVEARDRFEEALIILKKSGSAAQMIAVLSSIAGAYAEMGRLKGAKEAYYRAIEISSEAEAPVQEASCRINLSDNLRI